MKKGIFIAVAALALAVVAVPEAHGWGGWGFHKDGRSVANSLFTAHLERCSPEKLVADRGEAASQRNCGYCKFSGSDPGLEGVPDRSSGRS